MTGEGVSGDGGQESDIRHLWEMFQNVTFQDCSQRLQRQTNAMSVSQHSLYLHRTQSHAGVTLQNVLNYQGHQAVFGRVRPWAVRLPGVGDYMAVFGRVRPWAVRLPGVGVTERFFSIQGWLMTSMRGRRLWGSCRSNWNNRNDSRHVTYQMPMIHIMWPIRCQWFTSCDLSDANDSCHMTYQMITIHVTWPITYQMPTIRVTPRMSYLKTNSYWARQLYSTYTKCTY